MGAWICILAATDHCNLLKKINKLMSIATAWKCSVLVPNQAELNPVLVTQTMACFLEVLGAH